MGARPIATTPLRLASVTAAAGRAGLLKGLVDVTWYGASPGASDTVNKAAFDAALVAGDIFIPPGTYNITSLASIAGRAIVGAGRENTILRTTSATADVITVGAVGYVTITGLQFQSSVTRSAGSYVYVTDGPFQIEDFLMTGAFRGITVADGSSHTEIFDGRIDSTVASTGIGILIGTGTGTGPLAVFMDGIVCDNDTGARPDAHVKIVNCGDASLTNCQLIHAASNLQIAPGNSQSVVSVDCLRADFDQAGTYNIEIAPTGTGGVLRSQFTACWAAQAGTANVYMAATGSAVINGIDFYSLENYDSTNGLVATGTGVTNIQVHGGQHADNSSSGLSFTDVVGGCVLGALVGAVGAFSANGTGLTLAGTTNNFIVDRRQITGNSTNITNSASGTNIQGVWIRTTPTPTPSSGAFTATCTLDYLREGSTLYLEVLVSISDNGTAPAAGTAGGYVAVTLPGSLASVATVGAVLAGRENASTGNMVQGYIAPGGTAISMFTYDNKYPGGTGTAIYVSGAVQVA